MTDLIDARREWPDRLYILHPSVKTFGHAVTSPERKEYVRADITAARIRELEAQIADARNAALGEAADAAEHQAVLFASDEYSTQQPLASLPERFACAEVAAAIRALKEPTP